MESHYFVPHAPRSCALSRKSRWTWERGRWVSSLLRNWTHCLFCLCFSSFLTQEDGLSAAERLRMERLLWNILEHWRPQRSVFVFVCLCLLFFWNRIEREDSHNQSQVSTVCWDYVAFGVFCVINSNPLWGSWKRENINTTKQLWEFCEFMILSLNVLPCSLQIKIDLCSTHVRMCQ